MLLKPTTVYPDFNVLKSATPVPKRHRLKGQRPSTIVIAPNSQYLALHYDRLSDVDAQKRMSVGKWPGGPTFYHKPLLMRPALFAQGRHCFGYEMEHSSSGDSSVVVRRVSDWSLMGECPSGLLWGDIADPKRALKTQWHLSGNSIIQFSQNSLIFEMWDTFLGRSRRMPGSPSIAHITDLLTSPTNNVVIALCADMTIIVWSNLVFKNTGGSAHNLQDFQDFFVQDAAYLNRLTLHSIHLATIDRWSQSIPHTGNKTPVQIPDTVVIDTFSDGTCITRTREHLPEGMLQSILLSRKGPRDANFTTAVFPRSYTQRRRTVP